MKQYNKYIQNNDLINKYKPINYNRIYNFISELYNFEDGCIYQNDNKIQYLSVEGNNKYSFPLDIKEFINKEYPCNNLFEKILPQQIDNTFPVVKTPYCIEYLNNPNHECPLKRLCPLKHILPLEEKGEYMIRIYKEKENDFEIRNIKDLSKDVCENYIFNGKCELKYV